ncbi:hypothetical protein HZF09_00250 [Ramlibacter sp. CGMCC 1.13660]|nr:hypothetical protein [Ramlibacter sp. CGMCC 1.13660]
MTHSIFGAIGGLFIATASFAVHAEPTKPDQFDVVGVRFGMTVDEAKAALKAHDARIVITDEATFKEQPGLRGGGIAAVKGCIADQKNPCREQITVHFGQSTKQAYSIVRFVLNNEDSAQQAVVDGLKKKYGAPFIGAKDIRNDGGNLWGGLVYSPKGERLPTANCPPGDALTPPRHSNASCGLSIWVTAEGSGMQKGRSGKFLIGAADHTILMKEIQAQQAAAPQPPPKKPDAPVKL